MIRLLLVAALAAALGYTAVADAQTVRSGALVRVTAPAVRPAPFITRTAAPLNDTTLVLRGAGGVPIVVQRADLVRLEVGHTRFGGRQGAVWGGVVGASLGLLLGAAVASTDIEGTEAAVLGLGSFGAVTGASTGFLLGEVFRRSGWREVPLAPPAPPPVP